MTSSPSYFDRLRQGAKDVIVRNSLALGSLPATGAARDEGAMQIALNGAEKRIVKGMMAASGADRRFDATMEGLTDGQFSKQDLRTLEDRALGAANWSDVNTLGGIEEGVPVTLTPAQKTVVDRIVGQLGGDRLGQRARGAYGGAVSGGRIRTR